MITHKSKIFLLLFVFFTLLGSCQKQPQSFVFTRFSMDTVIDYSIVAPSRESAKEAMLKAQQEIERVSGKFWELDSSSEVYRFNHSQKGIYTDEETYRFFRRAKQISEETGYAFDITIDPVLELYDFKSDSAVPPSSEAIHKSLSYIGMPKITLSESSSDSTYFIGKSSPKVSVAVGGIAKGYAVDQAIEILKLNGVNHALINAGGDLYCLGNKGKKSWVVGIQNPRDLNNVSAVLNLENAAIATSGDYQRYFMYKGKRYHHILNPKTGRPGRLSWSASVIAPTTETADAWATALFVLGPQKGISLANQMPEIEAAIIDTTGRMHYSDGFERYLRAED